MVALVTTFLVLGWWQVGRARGGNTLSFGCAFEWPLFAGFVVVAWVKELRAELRREEPPRPAPAVEVPDDLARQPGYVPFQATPAWATPARAVPGADDGDPELMAY